jgi:ABC-type polysaccharide/polyol phosphate export permease
MLMKSRIPPDYLSTYLLLNPMAIFLTMSRSAFTNQPLGVDSMMVAASVAHALVIYCIGSYWFRKKNDTAVKYL